MEKYFDTAETRRPVPRPRQSLLSQQFSRPNSAYSTYNTTSAPSSSRFDEQRKHRASIYNNHSARGRGSAGHRGFRSSSQHRLPGRAQTAFHTRSSSQNRASAESSQHHRERGQRGHRPHYSRRPQNNDRNFTFQSNEHTTDMKGRENSEENQTNEFSLKPIGYRAVEEMVNNNELDAGNIALRLSTESSGFVVRLKTEMHEGWIQMLLKLMAKLCTTENPSPHLNHVLLALLNNEFEFKALKFLKVVLGKRPLNNVDNAVTHVSNCLHLMRGWLIYTQNTSEQAIQILLLYIKGMVAQHTLGEYENIQERLLEIDDMLQNCYQQPQKSTDRSSRSGGGFSHEEEPPDDFRAMSVFPTNDDIKTKESPFVRTNLVDSAYRSTDHYLDVQFRLLREDFVRPLREGINDFTNPDTGIFMTGKKKRRYQGLKAYDNVKIEFPKLSATGIYYCIHFDNTRLQNIQWQNSKRLLYGNLVCLSSDDFEDHFLFATVTNRDVEQLKMGYIEVEFLNMGNRYERFGAEEGENALGEVNESNLVSVEDMKKTYCMVESEAYFEAYRHVLTGLKETHEIPLSRYIVDCQPDLQPPAYLRQYGASATYDFSSILDDATNTTRKTYRILDTDRWPGTRDLKLDNSQVKALKSALTDELSIIQGPPGTGKTHVGLMIVKMLLGNKATGNQQPHAINYRYGGVHEIAAAVPNNPILVVCFTNHALDQFLEGIAKFHPKGLIRVGGRCKTDSLKQYMLSSVRRSTRQDRDKATKKTVWEIRNDLENRVSLMQDSEEILKESTQSILSLQCLQQVIPRHLLDQLLSFGKENDDEKLLQWLGVQKKVYSFPEEFYIVEETVNAMFAPLSVRRGFTKNNFIAAMNATGCLDADSVLNWWFMNQVPHKEMEPNADVVFAFLDQLRIPFNPNILMGMGYYELEVKCAWLVCSMQFGPENAIEDVILSWLSDKRETEPGSVDAMDDDDNIEDESEYLQDQRMIDMENEDQVQFIRVDQRNQRKGKGNMKKNKLKITAVRHDQMAAIDDLSELDGGFQYQRKQRQRRKRELTKQMQAELSKVDTMSEEEAESVVNIAYLNRDQKWKLYRYWVGVLRAKLRNDLSVHASEYNRLAKGLAHIRSQEDQSLLQNADVIAMTTTGAAKYRALIYPLPVKVMIVEEAAEVLEAHIVTSMPQTTEHLILIGDHQQLKPSPTVYELARKFNLDTSLFERLVKNRISCSRLALQHRMRPRIADLVRPHIYKELNDHPSVFEYENVVGVQKNVFFLSHTHEEDNVRDTMSKANQYEADFIVSLCRYLLHQGYLPEQITILTAYVGQLFAFKKVMARKLSNKKVRVTAVDNFQGEENDIILLSLVRSNDEGKIGFLSIENRVCVALSRAKKGLFCIGNFEMLKANSDLWRKILKGLKDDDLVGETFPLQCKNHPEKITQVKTEKDFEKVPEGGCGQQCRYRLECGHVCPRLCHPDDENHEKSICRKPCEKLCEVGHTIKTTCSSKAVCKVQVDKAIPKCGHMQKVACHKNPDLVTCQHACSKLLRCGHVCSNVCGTACARYCSYKVKVQRKCGHISEVSCSDGNNLGAKNCMEKCNEVLKCGHVCRGNCGQCKQGKLHVGCSNPKCGRPLCCGHICKERCSAVCPPCTEKCETSCLHSSCKKQCFVPCKLCKEKCKWKCPHWECSKLCSEPCDRPRCDMPCPKKIQCGHACIGLCGEPCPKLCRVCDKEKVTDIFFGDEDEVNARFVQLECGHIFTYENLDTWMEQENTNEGSETDIKLKECPRCKTPIRRSTRYGGIVNKQLMLINEVRKKIAGDPKEVETIGEELKSSMAEDADVPHYFPKQLEQLKKALVIARSLPALSVVETQFDCLAEFASIKKITLKLEYKLEVIKLTRDLDGSMDQVLEWLFSRKRAYFSDQEKEDLHMERQRCKDALKLIQIKDKLTASAVHGSDVDVERYMARICRYVFDDLSPYGETKQEKIKVTFEKIKRRLPQLIPGLGITDKERTMILGAMSLSKGHWYSCVNGHVYCIGECGGAVEEARCPHCNATIGGTGHRLTEGNRVATQMDGAVRSAWDPDTFAIPPEVLRWRDGL